MVAKENFTTPTFYNTVQRKKILSDNSTEQKQELNFTLLYEHQKKSNMCHTISHKKNINFYLPHRISYPSLFSYNMEERFVLIRKCQRRSIYSYVTLLTVQNDLHPSVSTILRFSKENYGEVEFARGVNKREGSS